MRQVSSLVSEAIAFFRSHASPNVILGKLNFTRIGWDEAKALLSRADSIGTNSVNGDKVRRSAIDSQALIIRPTLDQVRHLQPLFL
jgi:hypothetical protein